MEVAIPEKARQAFDRQQRNARRRGIPFLFTLTEWWTWWCEDERWERRGRTAQALVMARKGDIGPYAQGNVYCTTRNGNLADVDRPRWLENLRLSLSRASAEGRMKRPHLAVRGDGHPRSKAVVTPKGRFGSAALAAEAHGISPQAVSEKVRKGRPGWRYDAPTLLESIIIAS